MSICRWFVLISLPFLTLACGVEEGVVARVGHQRVVVETVQDYLAAVTGMPWQNVDMRVASRLLDQFLEQEAVFVSLGGAEIEVALDPGPRWALVRRIATEEWGTVPQVVEVDIQREVENRMVVDLPQQVYLRQMLFSDLATAEEARSRLAGGEDFLVLSKELSRAPNADSGGELGWVLLGSQPEDVEKVIFSLAEDEVSGPVRGPGGFHLFQALEIQEPDPPSRHRLEAQVRRDFEAEQERKHFQRCVDLALEKVGVEVFPVNLWFEYKGRFLEKSYAG